MSPRLLVVDRDARYREWLRHHLGVICPDAAIVGIDMEQFEHMHSELSSSDCDLVILVAHFGASPEDPASEGLKWLREFRNREDFPLVMALAIEGNELTAVRAMQLGAVDYIPKRLLTPERLNTAVRVALRQQELIRNQEANALAERVIRHANPVRDPIPGYVIRKTIGESEKAMVYLAHSTVLQRDVALKVSKIEREEGSDRQYLAREHTVLATIRHPSIVEIYEHGEHQGREYLAMEYFPRGDLKARLQRGIVELDCLRYAELIARALQVVHEAGILHRDLKPPNVMVREDDSIVLIDFGLARHLEGGIQSTRKGVLRGSPYYMSPEQALGEELDARTDLYSLGIIFYEMLTNRRPFTGTTAIDVLQQHVNAPLPQLPEHLSHLQQLLDGLLAKSREDRFANAAQVVEAIAGMRALRAA